MNLVGVFTRLGVCLQLFEVCSQSVNDYINADAIRFFHISFYSRIQFESILRTRFGRIS